MTGQPPGSGLLIGASSHDLGPQLEPQLKEACQGRLADVRWFRTDWQRGGAATAYAKVTMPEGGVLDAVVKVPVGPREYRFLTGLAQTEAPTPRVAFHGVELAGYDLAWVVMERLPGNPLAAKMHHEVLPHLIEAVCLFHAHSEKLGPLPAPDSGFNWAHLLKKARECIEANAPAHEQAWLNGIKQVSKKLPMLSKTWESRAITCWCHGDLHPGNAMLRAEGSAWGPPGTILLDFAEAHPGHWVEDAVYLERQFWGRPEYLDGIKPVSMLAKLRKEAGQECSDDYTAIANVRRLLMSAVSPAFMHREGGPRYLNAAREMMERMLALV